jgi:hypothetical protein
MIKTSLREFADRVLEGNHIGEGDVQELQRRILPDGIASQDEADVLIALDRAVASAHPAWGAYLTGAAVAFAVWTSRPTGRVDGETARWLTASLGCGNGPTDTAARIAFEVVQEAERVDEGLLAFALRAAERRIARERSARDRSFERFAG